MKPINTLFIGKVLIELYTCSSTNSYAVNLLSNNRPNEGTVILAHDQQHGKGQYGKRWLSEEYKNLTFSTILYPTFLDISSSYYLNMFVSVSIVEWLSSMEIHTDIKWPNDIYFKSEKLGGILIENSVSGNKFSSSVIGIGINVNQERFDPGIPNATSIKLISNNEMEIHNCLSGLLSKMEKYYLLLKRNERSLIRAAYLNSLYGLDKEIEYIHNGLKTRGVIKGIRENGELIIYYNGNEISYNNHEISVIKN